jgi:photosystem II stability/assembly factor-like uncharacterized protein
MPRLRCFGSLLLVTLAVTAPLAAQTATKMAPPDTRLLGGYQWRNLGPFRAGRVGAVSGAIGEPGTFYAGYPGGGLWKTTSAGQTWFPVFDGVREVSSVGAVEVAPSNPRIVYVGTGDMITGGTLDQGNGVYKSTDAGATWQHLGLAGTRHIQTMLVDPRNPDVVLVGALGDHIERSAERGVYRSTDGGRSWSKTLFVDNEVGVTKLARAFDVPNVIFAATAKHYGGPAFPTCCRSWQFSTDARLTSDSTRNGSALYKSVDGGVTWSELTTTGLPKLDGRMSVAVAIGTNAQRIYLITNSALYRSDDGGGTWTRMAADDERIHNGQGGYSAGVYVDPRNPDVVITLNTASYISRDGGKTFTGLKGAPGGDDPQQWWIDPTNGDRMLAGYDQGAIVSLDGGRTWSSWYNQSTEQIYHVATDNSFPYFVYGTQQDAGAIRTRVRGNLGAVSMFDWNPVNGWEWGTVLPDPLDPKTVYASGNGLVKITYPSEQWINVSPALDPTTMARTTNSQPLLFLPWNSRQLLLGLHYVASTVDGGVRWTRLSPDLGVPRGMDSATAFNTIGGRGAIESIAASRVGRGTIWAGTNNGLIHVTRDGGVTWRDVSIADLPTPRRANVSAISTSPTSAGTAYVAIEYLRVGDHTPYVYRTRDYGAHWTRIISGLPTDQPSGSFARVVRADPSRAGLLYLGTESGVHVSFDDGDHWHSLQAGLPNSPVRDLEVKDHDLVIATHGRGLWVLDDVSRLRQLAPSDADAAARVYAPATAVRMRRNIGSNTPLPPEIPHADNAPDGATIDYWLARDAADVRIEIVDAAGRVVRHLSSAAIAPVPEAARPPHPNFWVATPRPLATVAGAHRAPWDLRRDAPRALSHSFEINANPGRTPASPEGAMVPPGVYTIRLVANGTTSTATVTVVRDPRTTVTAVALAAQDSLLRALSAGIDETFADIEALTATRRGPVRDSAAMAVIDTLLGTARPRAVPGAVPHLSSFRAVHEAFIGQLNAQDNADFAPTPSMWAAYRSVCADYRLLKAKREGASTTTARDGMPPSRKRQVQSGC